MELGEFACDWRTKAKPGVRFHRFVGLAKEPVTFGLAVSLGRRRRSQSRPIAPHHDALEPRPCRVPIGTRFPTGCRPSRRILLLACNGKLARHDLHNGNAFVRVDFP
jgi:hypothetical protein